MEPLNGTPNENGYKGGEREINGKTVSLYQTEDEMQAMFQDGQYVYILEGNISEEEIIKIIEEMR